MKLIIIPGILTTIQTTIIIIGSTNSTHQHASLAQPLELSKHLAELLHLRRLR